LTLPFYFNPTALAVLLSILEPSASIRPEIFGYFTAIGLLFFGYRYLEYLANRQPVWPLEPFSSEAPTGLSHYLPASYLFASWRITASRLSGLRLIARRVPSGDQANFAMGSSPREAR
jgi:hypothetical protein